MSPSSFMDLTLLINSSLVMMLVQKLPIQSHLGHPLSTGQQ